MNIQIRYVGVSSYNRDILSCVRYPEKADSFIDVRERETKQQIDKQCHGINVIAQFSVKVYLNQRCLRILVALFDFVPLVSGGISY